MIIVWGACIITAIVHIVSVPFILSGKGDNFIAADKAKLQSNMKRLRSLMAILSASAATFCISIPFMMIGGNETMMLLMTAALGILTITIAVLSKTWAKKK